jgi:succinoglycan biosynthesis transport protein ExoP
MNTPDPMLRGNPSAGTALVKVPVEQAPFLRYVMRLALRWKKTIMAIVGGCLLIGLIITLLMTPQYTAISTIEIARESDKVVDLRGAQQESSDSDQEFYSTQYGLLKSRSLAERIAAQLQLVDDPAFFAMFDVNTDGPLFQAGRAGRLGAGGRPERLRIAGGLLLDNIDVAPVRSSRLVELSFTSPDPALSQKVANAWSTNFIEATLQRRYQANSYAREFLEKRLVQLRQRLEASERALVAYASAQRIINIPGTAGGAERSLNSDDLGSLNTALNEATADRVRAEARFRANQGHGGQASEALTNSTINSLRTKRAEVQADYQKLMLQFEPGYPPAQALKAQLTQIDRSIASEEGRINGSIELGYREALGREQGLKARVDDLKNSSLDLRRRNIQYQILQRDTDTNRGFYDTLLARYKEIGIAGGVGVNNVSIVDPADIPQRPSSPRLVLNMLLALVIGSSLGAIAAFLLEQADEAISDPAEVERMVGLPLLGSVPKLVGKTPSEALADRKSSMVDAYLAVQTNLAFSTEHGVPRSLAITSTRPMEGKSTTALALATTLARAQKRVVLVDGDMRSPSVHHLIGTDHRHGLSNFLAGDDEIQGLIHSVDNFGFFAITAGPIPPNAAELLTSERLKMLINRLLEQFDHVVIDSPPVMGLADAPLICSQVEGVIYAVESHGIRSSIVRTALNRLFSAHARVLGAVLTKFESRRNVGGYEYGYSYGNQD